MGNAASLKYSKQKINNKKMKKFLLMSMIIVGGVLGLHAQVTVSGDITANTTWTNNNIYMLTGGFVYVTNNATLTIEPGTIIKGNASTLVITRGAKLIADGTQTQPIVFTSFQTVGNRAPGDWGGIILCGKAPINDPAGQRLAEGGIDAVKGLYGGTDVNDNSGIIRYVRIEYAGIAYILNSETNGLTMGGVGSGTIIDYVQVSHGGDDSFEWFGGTVNCKHLISVRGVDDHFDTDYGFSGKVQFAVALADSAVADVSGSNGFESDNDGSGTINAPLTRPIFSNISFFGAKINSTTTINGNHKRGAHLRRSTALCVYNSFFAGFPTGLKLESDNCANNAKNNSLQYKNNIIAGSPSNSILDSAGITISWGAPYGSLLGWFNSNANSVLPNSLDIMAVNPYNYTNPNFLLQGASPAIAGASFASPNLGDAFFTPTTYRGAFDGSNDWTKCWANFDPQNTNYDNAGINYLAVTTSASGATTFCQGGSVTLTSTSPSNNVWSNGATTSSINVTASGNYFVTVTNAAGCVASTAPIAVTVNALPTTPTISAGSTTTFCQGGSVVLTSSATTGNTWGGGETTQAVTVSTSGNYSVTVQDGNGCSATSTVTSVTVNPLPSTPTVSASGATTFCTGGSVVLTSSATTGNTWTTGSTTDTIHVSSTGNYSVTVQDGNGCSATSAATAVNVSNAPLPTVSVTGNTTLCQGQSVVLTSTAADSYSWSNGATSQSITVTTAGTYNVTTTNANACNGVGQSANTVVVVNPTPTATGAVTSTNGFTVVFNNTSSGATSYSWNFGDLSSSSATAPTHVYTANGNYTVTLIASNGTCSDTTTIPVSITVGIDEIQNVAEVKMYPNPVNDIATVNVTLAENAQIAVNIFDITGKLVNTVYNDQMNAGLNTLSINVSELPAGIYFTSVTSGKYNKTMKMVVVK
jgi:PKD repeat protein